MGFRSTEALDRVTNSPVKIQTWKSHCYRHCWHVNSFHGGPRNHHKSSLIWHENDWVLPVWLLGTIKSHSFLALGLGHEVFPSGTLKAPSICLCPETSAAHPHLLSSAWSSRRPGVLLWRMRSISFISLVTSQDLSWAWPVQTHAALRLPLWMAPLKVLWARPCSEWAQP